MRYVKTGKVYFTNATCEKLGPAFAKAGYDIRKIRTLEQALQAWLATLSDRAVREFWQAMEERRKELQRTDEKESST